MPNFDAEERVVSVTIEEMAGRLVAAEIQEARVKRPYAQRAVARRAGIAPSAIENLLRGRIDAARISRPITRLYAAFLEQQLTRIQTEIAFAHARDPDRDLCEAEAAVLTGKEALRRRALRERETE